MTQANFTDTNNKLLTKIEGLSTDYQQLVLDFVDFLCQKQQKNPITQDNQQQENPHQKRGGYGVLKGKIWMSDDFDEPLEDLAEYM
jgi:hypothetical protein